MAFIVNLKEEPYEIYIGRPSIWGNPYALRHERDRDLVLIKYKKWFANKILEPDFREATLALKGKILGCYCKPKLCHGDVIVEWINSQ